MSPSALTSTSVAPERGNRKLYDSPARLLSVIVLAIIFAEMTEEFFLKNNPESGRDIIIDVFLMVIFLSPALYFFVFKPLLSHIEYQKRTENALRKSEEQLQHLSTQIMVIQEQERKEIAMELHDDLGQVLNITKLQVRYLGRKLREDQVEARDDIEVIAQFLDGGIESIRRLSRALSPCMLEDLGLTAALKGLTEDFRDIYDIAGVTSISPIDHFVSDRDRIFIYRIFQEALANIAKHAAACTVSVEVGHDGTNTLFSIEDDGKGFDVEKAAARDFSKRGLGLDIMRERARMIGGSLDVRSRTGKGTRLSFSVPVHVQKKEAVVWAPTG